MCSLFYFHFYDRSLFMLGVLSSLNFLKICWHGDFENLFTITDFICCWRRLKLMVLSGGGVSIRKLQLEGLNMKALRFYAIMLSHIHNEKQTGNSINPSRKHPFRCSSLSDVFKNSRLDAMKLARSDGSTSKLFAFRFNHFNSQS